MLATRSLWNPGAGNIYAQSKALMRASSIKASRMLDLAQYEAVYTPAYCVGLFQQFYGSSVALTANELIGFAEIAANVTFYDALF